MEVDTLIATLMSFGFDFQHCQQAVTAGKISVESAVEWLLQNSNAAGTGSPQNIAQSDACLPSLPLSGESSQLTSSQANKVVSRIEGDESHKKAQKEFEQRHRDSIRHEAKKLKLSEKKARQQVLQQIKEDRDISKNKPSSVNPRESPGGSEHHADNLSCSFSQEHAAGPSDEGKNKCCLKIRLSSGKNITELRDCDDTLGNIITQMKHCHHETEDVDIIQPFPHKTFSSDDLRRTLSELGLTPSCCLVLKKRVVPDAFPERSPDNAQNSAETQGNVENIPMDPPEVAGIDVLEDIYRGPAADQIGGNVLVEGLNELGVGPAPRPGHHFWGAGVSLGRPQFNPHAIDPVVRTESPGEAAVSRSRMLDHRGERNNVPEKPAELSFPSQDVSSLLDICVNDVARRLPGHQHPVRSLGSVSHQVCQKILKHLMRKKTLKPKTLACFIPCQLQRLVFDHYLYVTNELFHTIRYFKSLTHLSVQSCTVFTDKALEAIAGMKKLVFLDFSNCTQLTNKYLKHLKALENLRTLKLDNTKVTDDGLCDLFCGPGLEKLHSLSLNKTTITNKTLEALRGRKLLRELNIEQTNVSDLQPLEDLKNLTRLNLGGTKIDDQSLSFLNRLPLLTKLNLHQTQVTDNGLSCLRGLALEEIHLPGRMNITNEGIKYLQDLPLTSLDLTDYVNITDEAMRTVGQMTRLVRLSLSKTKISDIGIRFLVDLRELKELDLERTAVGDVGIEALSGFSKLEELNLSGTNITDDCLRSGKLNSLRALCKLNLSRTTVSDGYSRLQLPSLTHLNLDWTQASEECESLLIGCPQLKALRHQNCRLANPRGDR